MTLPRPDQGNPSLISESAFRSNLAGLQRRRDAASRLPALECGFADPLLCSHSERETTEQDVDSYLDAAAHLRAHGLTAWPNWPILRLLYKCDGEDRALSKAVAEPYKTVADEQKRKAA